jgi:hypothetical protein
VVHDELVTLEDRFKYLQETYGKAPYAVERLQVMKQDTMKLEQKIFLLLDFGPKDVFSLLP